MTDDPTIPPPRWMTTARATQVLGRRPGDIDADPANPRRIRSRLDALGRRQWLSTDVEERAREATPVPVSEQARKAEEIFARWAQDAKRRRERVSAALAGVSHG